MPGPSFCFSLQPLKGLRSCCRPLVFNVIFMYPIQTLKFKTTNDSKPLSFYHTSFLPLCLLPTFHGNMLYCWSFTIPTKTISRFPYQREPRGKAKVAQPKPDPAWSSWLALLSPLRVPPSSSNTFLYQIKVPPICVGHTWTPNYLHHTRLYAVPWTVQDQIRSELRTPAHASLMSSVSCFISSLALPSSCLYCFHPRVN